MTADKADVVTVIVPVNDLVPEVRADLEQARGASGWLPDHVQAISRRQFDFLGPYMSGTIKSDNDTDVLILTFTPPPGRDPLAAEADYQHASDLANEGGLDQAAVVFQELVIKFPEVAKYHSALGQAHFELGDFEAAEVPLVNALRLDPEDHRGLLILGNLCMRRRELDRAVYFYRAAVAVTYEPCGLTNLGAALGETGDSRGAIEAFREALAIDPGYTAAISGLQMAQNRPQEDR